MEYCKPCDRHFASLENYQRHLDIHHKCTCVIKNREEHESQRDWMKRWMCQWHWMSTDYYKDKNG